MTLDGNQVSQLPAFLQPLNEEALDLPVARLNVLWLDCCFPLLYVRVASLAEFKQSSCGSRKWLLVVSIRTRTVTLSALSFARMLDSLRHTQHRVQVNYLPNKCKHDDMVAHEFSDRNAVYVRSSL